MRLKPLIPDKNASLRAAVRAVDSKVRPDFRRAIVYAVLAFTLDGATPYFGGVHAATLDRRLAAYGTAAGFVVFGLAATRSAASELSRVTLSRAGAAAATPLRVGCLLVGYLIVALTAMDLFALPVGNLLVGGAVTGMILGIAAQQALSNVFAGLVLLFARPYNPGEKVRIRSGALGGTLDGTVTSVGLLYTTLSTEDGVLNIPNGALLAAAVGPLPRDSSWSSSAHKQGTPVRFSRSAHDDVDTFSMLHTAPFCVAVGDPGADNVGCPSAVHKSLCQRRCGHVQGLRPLIDFATRHQAARTSPSTAQRSAVLRGEGHMVAKKAVTGVKNKALYKRLRNLGVSAKESARVARASIKTPSKKASARGGAASSYDNLKVPELQRRAKKAGIKGRSTMNKKQLVKALRAS